VTQVPLPVPAVGPSPFDAIKREDEQGEWWLARELQAPLGYSVWRDFTHAIERAKLAAENTGVDVASNFADARKVTNSGPAAADYRLTRYACYLVAMNGDPRKQEIAEAQTYFAVRTREAEVAGTDKPMSELEMAQRYVAALEREQVLKAELETAAPKARSWDVLASGAGDYSVADAAKVLSRDPAIKLGQGRLFTLLGQYGWAYRQRGDDRWRPYQSAVETGRLSELPASHYHPRTAELVIDPPQVRVTPKGLHELHRRLGGTQPLTIQPELEGAR
jgi:DNA-damage-inducible protein D